MHEAYIDVEAYLKNMKQRRLGRGGEERLRGDSGICLLAKFGALAERSGGFFKGIWRFCDAIDQSRQVDVGIETYSLNVKPVHVFLASQIDLVGERVHELSECSGRVEGRSDFCEFSDLVNLVGLKVRVSTHYCSTSRCFSIPPDVSNGSRTIYNLKNPELLSFIHRI